MSERDRSVAIIGGLGKMGQVTRRMFETAGYPVVISDKENTGTIAPREAIRKCETVFFSVPVEVAAEMIQATADVFGPDQNIMDDCTTKKSLIPGYKMIDRDNNSITSVHFLFKDDQPPPGQNALVLPYGKNWQRATSIAEEVCGKAGMVIIRMPFEEHDSDADFTQFKPHLINRTIGLALAEIGVNMELLIAMSTANSRMFNLALWRTLIQSSVISASIIRNLGDNPNSRQIVKELGRAMKRIIRESHLPPGKLEKTFDRTVEKLDPTGEIRLAMNIDTISILEHLANLKVHSVTITTADNNVGSLNRMTGILAGAGINMNAIWSHIDDLNGSVRFDIGIGNGEMTDEVMQELENNGFHVANVVSRK
ncbi:MAG: prephenate dehydrogenase/arogenate dehydrogenase family protein [Candidatus Roizmanbacteria bacterium]|nr:MAG: prephenate dehydrogenase/arogenate dehydrogenase family protein [Candidatus Roizmanbacteria bacterium]